MDTFNGVPVTEREAATALLLKYWQGKSVPVRPEVIARAEGLAVQFLPDNLPDVSGEYLVEDGRPTIRFNRSESPLRQRFTIAHELGHHVMRHGPRYRDTVSALSSPTFDSVEASANRFAAELLMPVYAIAELVKNKGLTSLPELASSFAVSEIAMRYRLKNLGYLK
jgi:Zn-dependent peptidase ImmA (M78 family)